MYVYSHCYKDSTKTLADHVILHSTIGAITVMNYVSVAIDLQSLKVHETVILGNDLPLG